MEKSYGFRPDRYNQIIVFDCEDDFKRIVAANPDMTAIMGADDYTKSEYPGLFIAGVKNVQSSTRKEAMKQRGQI